MKTIFILPVLAFAPVFPAGAQNPGKVGVINIQRAIAGTKDGQKAAAEIQSRFSPKKKELDDRQAEVARLQDQLGKGGNTLSDDARQKLMREIDQKNKSITRDTEDARADLDQAEQKVMSELGGRIQAVIDKYAKDSGYTLILDISSPQTPVVFASSTIDITKDIIDMYDKNAPASSAPAPATAKPPAAPKPPAPKPAAPK